MGMHSYNEPVEIKLYIDYRDPSIDNYPQIALCDGCAESLEPYVCEQTTLGPQEGAECERCNSMNAVGMRAMTLARRAHESCASDLRK